MTIKMQGDWTIRVKRNNAAFAQRFTVSGAATGNGTYDGIMGNAVRVSGAQWSVGIEHRPTGQSWRDSAQRLGLPVVSDGLLRFEITSNDGGLDVDYDDLVLACSLPASRSDHVVYGTVKTYSQECLFNPLRDDYIVIDQPFHLDSVCARYPKLREVIGKLYPERQDLLHHRPADPALDPTPVVIPSGLPNVAVGLVFQSQLPHPPACGQVAAFGDGKNPAAAQLDLIEAEAVSALRTIVKRVPFKASPLKAGASRLARRELEAIAEIRDAAIRFRCEVEPAPGMLLRFQQYTRTAAECQDGPYTGTGLREDLGQAVTDEQGNYLFRFRPTRGQDGAEVADMADSEALATARRPDVIVQVLGAGPRLCFETAPYDNIANLRRIDLCLPHAQAQPNLACADAHATQRASDVVVLHSATALAPGERCTRRGSAFRRSTETPGRQGAPERTIDGREANAASPTRLNVTGLSRSAA